MEKDLYFANVELIKALEAQLSALNKEWNTYTCWYGTPEEQENHTLQSKYATTRIENIRKQLKEARKEIPRETLNEWSKEFNKR